MVSEVARICGRVGFVLGVTSYLGRAWWGFGALHGVTAWVLNNVRSGHFELLCITDIG